jgi:phage regulator Rha-like protein
MGPRRKTHRPGLLIAKSENIFNFFLPKVMQITRTHIYIGVWSLICVQWLSKFTEERTDTMKNEIAKIQNMIYEIRGQKVMFDNDLAALYEVETKRLNESVKRNIKRFPPEFMFQLTDEEWKNLRSQNATFNRDVRKYKPYVFTEHGILMLSSSLNSDKAISVNIQIMKIFVQMRRYVISQDTTNEQIAELRKLLLLYIEKNDKRVEDIITVLNRLLAQPPKQTKRIGFVTDDS